MNANTNINVLGGILDAMLANLVETIDKRVEAQVLPLTQRIMALEIDNAALQTDLKAVEGQLYDLKNATPVVSQPTLGAAVMDLQSEEFRLSVIKIIDQQVMEDTFLDPLVEAVTDSDKFNDAVNSAAQEAARSEAEEMISDHCSDYDHDDIHETSDHEVDEDAVKDIIKEVLNNTTVTLKI
jgi:hypothetical protein